MYKGKKLLAIIPARSGSKGLKNKNILPLQGKPLIAYAIEGAQEAGVFDKVFVSTDSEEYAEIARAWGAEVPFLRPDELATDMALACDYVLHALQAYQEVGCSFDYFAILQPTSPLRTGVHIEEAVKMLIDEEKTSVVSVTASSHPANCYGHIPKDGSLEGFAPAKGGNRQGEQYLYRLNGAIYLCSCEEYRRTQNFYGPNSKAYIMGNQSSIDIDTQEDFNLVKWIMDQK